jgi:cytochrome c peroxidase
VGFRWMCIVAVGVGLSAFAQPSDAPKLQALQDLGERVFFAPLDAGAGSLSCATCHQPAQAFTDGKRVSEGIHGQLGTRNAPSLLNLRATPELFWDGRRKNLADLMLDPLLNPIEHGFKTAEDLLSAIRAQPELARAFATTYSLRPEQIQTRHVAQALAAYVGGLQSGDSGLDRFVTGRSTMAEPALSAAAVRGLELFTQRAQCAACHAVEGPKPLLTDNQFHAVGTGGERWRGRLAELTQQVVKARQGGQALDHVILNNAELAALGRFVVTLNPADIGKFRTPSLRNVAITAPYMHDGSVATLEEAVDQEIYYRGQSNGQPLILTPAEKADLIAFLRELTDDAYRAGPPVRTR